MDDVDLGTGWGFPPQFYNNGKDVRLVTDEEDVKESLEIIFSTALHQRLFYPDFGADMKRFVFEKVNYALSLEIQQMVADVIAEYEPRITVKKIEITESEDNAYILLIYVYYYIKGIEGVRNMEHPLEVYR